MHDLGRKKRDCTVRLPRGLSLSPTLSTSKALHSLQGALGKTSGRSYKAAPRQLLQVDASSATISGTHPHISKEDGNGAAQEAAKLGREALGQAAGVRVDALNLI